MDVEAVVQSEGDFSRDGSHIKQSSDNVWVVTLSISDHSCEIHFWI